VWLISWPRLGSRTQCPSRVFPWSFLLPFCACLQPAFTSRLPVRWQDQLPTLHQIRSLRQTHSLTFSRVRLSRDNLQLKPLHLSSSVSFPIAYRHTACGFVGPIGVRCSFRFFRYFNPLSQSSPDHYLHRIENRNRIHSHQLSYFFFFREIPSAPRN